MKKLIIVATCIFAMTLLAGCFGGGGGSGSGGIFGGSDTEVAGIFGGGSGSSSSSLLGHSPEPATVLLLGGGLVAYAFMKRKKKK